MSSGFLDEVIVDVSGGRGGRGAVSFRREKYVPNGGPDGGDGGPGGSVIVVADSGDSTLSAFRERRRFHAQPGGDGAGKQQTGRDAPDIVLHVPPGTVITNADGGELVADLDRRGARAVVAAGGRGGRGNARFATATRQAPRLGELGSRGEARRLRFELKLIADIGLVGRPNAGKSSLLARLTSAHPKVAAYPFTTLHPNLGVAELEGGRTVVIADVPGIIEGAHRGVGLGLEFLRHLERTRALLHLVDASDPEAEARAAVGEIAGELEEFSPALGAKPRQLVFTKLDLEQARENRELLATKYPDALFISAATGDGCEEALRRAVALADAARAEEPVAAVPADAETAAHRVYRHQPREQPIVVRDGDAYRVIHPPTERIVERTDMQSDEAVGRLQRRLRRTGVDAALADAGCRDGDTVRIGEVEFEYAADAMAPP